MNFANLIQQGAQRNRPLKWLIYSEPKLGKSHLCAGSPGVFFLDCERGSLEFDVGRALITDWGLFVDGLFWLEKAEHDFKTVVIDTLDSLERLACSFVAQRDGKASVKEVGGGFGNGWAEVEELWHQLTSHLDRIQVKRGLNVIVLAHSDLERFKDPDSGQDWDRWTMRASKKTLGVFRGWVDEILFMKREVTTKTKRDMVGRQGSRVVFTDSGPGRIAGSRRGLPPRIVIPDGDPERAWKAMADAARKAAKKSKGAAPPPPPAEEPEEDAAPADEAEQSEAAAEPAGEVASA